jgi:hypothetical protein
VESIGALNVSKIELLPALINTCSLLQILFSACDLPAQRDTIKSANPKLSLYLGCPGLNPSVTEDNVMHMV